MKEKLQAPNNTFIPRRNFLKDSAIVLGGTIIGAGLPVNLRAAGGNGDSLKIALIGCGARGLGATVNALMTKGKVELVAMADVFKNNLDKAYSTLLKIDKIKESVKVPEKNRFVGFDAYQKAIALADVVLLATPPAFRPMHFEEAVQAGKHVFMEKPLASDAPGIRKIVATGQLATRKNLKVVVGLQNRYDPGFIEMVKRLKNGAIGDIVSASDYYLIGPVTRIPRQAGQTEMEFQMRNWRNFNWLWAGSPAGLQIHNTDIVNWVKGSYPVRAQGMGGRSYLNDPEYGDIFDHFFIEYEYADGTKLNSQIRHISGTWNKGGAYFLGTKGSGNLEAGIKDLSGNLIWKFQEENWGDAYQIEHDKLFAAIRNNMPINDTEWAAMSTMTTILGRMAAHSGKMIEWDDAFKSDLTLFPKKLSWDTEELIKPDKDGNYAVPIPGQSDSI